MSNKLHLFGCHMICYHIQSTSKVAKQSKSKVINSLLYCAQSSVQEKNSHIHSMSIDRGF